MAKHFPWALLLALSFSLSLSACAGGGTTLILLPDAAGKVGTITVKTKNDTRVVSQAFGTVTATEGASHLSATSVSAESDVKREYAQLLAAEPLPSASFMVYFVSNSSELVADSMAQFPAIAARIKAQMPTEVSVIGHTDTRGSASLNDRLALKRAQDVARMLTERIPNLRIISVQSFGAKELLVPTPPNVDEPRNRRVEILIL